MAFDFRLLTASPFGPPFGAGMFFRIIQQFAEGEDEDNDGSHLPLVQHIRDFKRRSDNLDASIHKYSEKTANTVEGIQSDLRETDDEEAKRLTNKLLKVNQMMQDFLQGIHPIIEEQKAIAKELLDYLCPPTVELFHKKANAMLAKNDNRPQQVSSSKKNVCAICMDNSANCVIKRSCEQPSPSSSSYSRRHTHCEKDCCRCGPTMCRDCLLTHYWTSTEKGSKSYARCVCCRAEFCLKDVFPVEYVDDPASQKSGEDKAPSSNVTKEPQQGSEKDKDKDKDKEKVKGKESKGNAGEKVTDSEVRRRSSRGRNRGAHSNDRSDTSEESSTRESRKRRRHNSEPDENVNPEPEPSSRETRESKRRRDNSSEREDRPPDPVPRWNLRSRTRRSRS
jgi:hypothetical protein